MALHEYDLKKLGFFILFVLAVVGTVIGIGAGFYFYTRYQKTVQELQVTQQNSQDVVKFYVEKVGKLIDLPQDEEPQIATVTDLERLKNQPFFARAKVGDRVLLYTKNKKAILYDPVANKVMEVGPLILPTDTTGSTGILGTTGQPSPSPSPKLALTKIVIANGTDDQEAADKMEKRLKEIKDVKLTVTEKLESSQKEYANSLIVDISGQRQQEGKKLGELLSIGLGKLPEGEKAPEGADLLIIVGLDRPQ